MPLNVTQQFPATRVLLPRTRLAYVHLRNLLTDAKRDRSARVSGYVIVWLPEETLILYLRQGELVNATSRRTGGPYQALPLRHALELVPTEPEYGEICFHEADVDQLACMYTAQTTASARWPSSFAFSDPAVLFPYLMSMTFDGFLEITAGDRVNYLVFKDGAVSRPYLSGNGGSGADRLARLFGDAPSGELTVARWGDAALPTQAPPALVDAYRELALSLVQRLRDGGSTSALAIAEHAREDLIATHPVLEGLPLPGHVPRDMVADAAATTAGVAAWMAQVLWTVVDCDLKPEALLRDLTWERRHLFQSAGLYERLPWKL